LAWDSKSDDLLVNSAAKRIADKTIKKATEMGITNRFIYLNYANITQDVFAGYGEENRERLREIQKNWDPEGLWSRLSKGGFKV